MVEFLELFRFQRELILYYSYTIPGEFRNVAICITNNLLEKGNVASKIKLLER